MLILPDWTPLNIALYLFFGLYAISFGFLDYFAVMQLRYSKFATEKGVPSRIGMVIVYVLPIVAVTVCAISYLQTATLMQWTVYGALIFHFGKRVLEALFVHKYSGTMELLTVGTISVFYALMAGTISWLNAHPAPDLGIWFYAGLILFIIGQVGNFWHHILLANLRKEKAGYHIPRGGWFEGAACPHYFFEMLVWLGIVLLSRHLFALLVFVSMSGYLISRSIKTRQWYQKRFPDYPSERRLMIPFIF